MVKLFLLLVVVYNINSVYAYNCDTSNYGKYLVFRQFCESSKDADECNSFKDIYGRYNCIWCNNGCTLTFTGYGCSMFSPINHNNTTYPGKIIFESKSCPTYCVYNKEIASNTSNKFSECSSSNSNFVSYKILYLILIVIIIVFSNI